VVFALGVFFFFVMVLGFYSFLCCALLLLDFMVMDVGFVFCAEVRLHGYV